MQFIDGQDGCRRTHFIKKIIDPLRIPYQIIELPYQSLAK
jgi:hypothetical protein